MARKNNNKVTSHPGLFGTTNHYDSKGKKIGESRPGFFGSTNHYDAKGKKIGSSQKGAFGRSVHYDSKGHKTGTSYSSVFGTDHYDAKGRSAGHTNRSGFGTRQSSFGDNGNFTMVDRDDRRRETSYRSNDDYHVNADTRTYDSSRTMQSDGDDGTAFFNLLLIFPTVGAAFIFIFNLLGILIGYVNPIGLVVSGAFLLFMVRRLRKMGKKKR